MKKLMLLAMAFTVFFAFSAHDTADAAKRGGFKAPKKSFTQTPAKPADNVNRTDGGTAKPAAGAATGAAATKKPGFFGGGSFMKGMMIGGLAGLMFGSLFAGMGAFGNLLGFLVNVIAIVALFMIIRAVIGHFRARKRLEENRRPY